VQNDVVCFCKREMMSICTAQGHSQQMNCRYYTKSSYNNKCMYYVFDEFCDCVEAQKSTANGMVLSLP
jgi:hypothetical protein